MSASRTRKEINDLAYMAATIYGEARGEDFAGKVAVGAVIMNRVKKGGWYMDTVKGVVTKPWQFSCWNVEDPNYDQTRAIRDMLIAGQEEFQSKTINECVEAAKINLIYLPEDPTKGSLHYHAKGITPIWTHGKQPVAEIGNHLFYNNID